jgi:uncharacterized protein (TIGR03084 family)
MLPPQEMPMPAPMQDLLDDLVAERAVLITVLSGVPESAWDTPSPAEGWTLRDCAAHLADFDDRAAAVAETGSFDMRAGRKPAKPPLDRHGLQDGQLWARAHTSAEVLDWYRQSGERLLAALAPLDPRHRLPWAGPPMSARSFTTARLMEHWSHGLDIHDAAGVVPVDTDRLRHIAHIGYITRDFSYANRGLEPPSTQLRLELAAPSGASWTWGPEDADDRVSGSAGDFCRVVTQRIHVLDTSLRAQGPHAAEFLELAQAFAGPTGGGRQPKGTSA